MVYLDHRTENPKWLDSRMYSPNPDSLSYFEVVIKCHVTTSLVTGRACFKPKNQYTEGDWTNLQAHNGNPCYNDKKDIVMLWRQHATVPEHLLCDA